MAYCMSLSSLSLDSILAWQLISFSLPSCFSGSTAIGSPAVNQSPFVSGPSVLSLRGLNIVGRTCALRLHLHVLFIIIFFSFLFRASCCSHRNCIQLQGSNNNPFFFLRLSARLKVLVCAGLLGIVSPHHRDRYPAIRSNQPN